MRPLKLALLLVPVLVVALAPPAVAQRRGAVPVLHEPIPPDPREDIALAVSLDGDIPAAINTPRGLVQAPDPAKPLGTGDSPYNHAPGDARDTSFHPDRDTRRPDVLPYDDPFSPSTAPFKRLSAFDTVDASYTLSVRDAHTTPLPVMPTPAPDASEEQFYADMVVDLVAGQKVRIPSVAPGSRVLRARAGVGTQDVRFQLWKDGAENWFIEAESSTRARIVMELSAPRAAFGGDFGNPSWAELLPEDVFERVVTAPHAKIVARLREMGVQAPVIGFPRGAGALVEGYARGANVQGVGLDVQAPADMGRRLQANGLAIQGALDPLLLRAGGRALDVRVDGLLEQWSDGPYIFNLGHGVLPDTPIENIDRVVRRVTGA